MEEATKDFSEGLSEEEFDEALEEAENQETYDQETGLDLEIVLTAARDQDIDLFALEEGESVEFYVEAPFFDSNLCSINDKESNHHPWFLVLLRRLWTWLLSDSTI